MSSATQYRVDFHANTHGPVVGDGNVVYQHFYVPPTEIPQPVAPPPPAYFLGRDGLLKQVHDWLILRPGLPIMALWGIPGVGKSALARTLARRTRALFPDGCIWVEYSRAIDNEQNVSRFTLERCAQALGQEPRFFSTLAALRDRVRAILDHKTILLVLDNCQATEALDTVADILNTDHSSVLLTTDRRTIAQTTAEWAVEVEPLTPQWAQQLLVQHSRLENEAALDDLAKKTLGVPFLIEIIGRRIRSAHPAQRANVLHTVADELSNPARLLTIGQGNWVYHDLLLMNYRAAPPLAQRVFHTFGLLNTQPVDTTLLTEVLESSDEAVLDALYTLSDLALVEQNTDERWHVPAAIHSLATELVEQIPDHSQLFQAIVQRLQARLKHQNPADEEQSSVYFDHFMHLLNQVQTVQDWQLLRQITNFVILTVSGEFNVIYDAQWPLSELSVKFADGCHIEKVDLRACKAGNLHFVNAWLHKVDFTCCAIGNLHATQTTFNSVTFSGADTGNLYFTNCVINQLDLRGARVGNIYLTECHVSQLVIDRMHCGHVYLTDCVVTETDFTTCEYSSLQVSGNCVLINVKIGPYTVIESSSDSVNR